MLLREAGLLLLDIAVIIFSMTGALWIRHDFHLLDIEPTFFDTIRSYLFVNLICTVLIFAIMKLYSSLWRFASIVELKNVILATVLSTLLQSMGMWYMELPIPRSYPFLYLLLLWFFCG